MDARGKCVVEKGFKIITREGFSVNYQIGDEDKKALLAEFGKTFTQCRKMIDWFDDTQETEDQKLEWMPSLYNILEGLHDIMKLMYKSGITEREIAETLNLPF